MRPLIIWAGLLAVPTASNLAQTAPESKYANDPRLSQLQEFFEKTHSPIKHLAADFLIAADRHRLDWRLLPSISLIESGAGKAAQGNNIFGWDSGRKVFASIRESIYTVASRLGNSKLYRGKSLDQVLSTYNPLPDYAGKVKAVMRRMGGPEPAGVQVASRDRVSFPSYALPRIAHPAPAP